MSVATVTPIEALDLFSAWDTQAALGDAPCPLVVVDLRDIDRSFCAGSKDRSLIASMQGQPFVIAGLVGADLDVTLAPLADSFDLLIGEATGANAVVDVADLDTELENLAASIAASPHAAVALVQLLRISHDIDVAAALHAESLTYATLQTGATFMAWLARRANKPAPKPVEPNDPTVLVERVGSHLEITLNRPARRNALNVAMRDELTQALAVVGYDDSLDGAILRGAGSNFSAGGDLDEFGSTPSPAVGHHVRSVRSLPLMMHRLAARVRVNVHGGCVGAGIELPAFLDSVIATEDATFVLPEIGFGLVPGAGGTVSVTRRIGRHRTAWLALTGSELDARTALQWRLVDRVI